MVYGGNSCKILPPHPYAVYKRAVIRRIRLCLAPGNLYSLLTTHSGQGVGGGGGAEGIKKFKVEGHKHRHTDRQKHKSIL